MESIVLLQPAPGSEVSSPVVVEGFSAPTFEQNLIVMITDIYGVLLALQSTTIQAEFGQAGMFRAEINFEVSDEMPGRISVYDVSARDGGLLHLASAHVVFKDSGLPEISLAFSRPETIAILSPLMLEEISGGVLQIEGYSEYFFESNLGIMVCGEGGTGALHDFCGTEDNILAQGYAMIASPDIGQPGPFSGEIAYNVAGRTHARLVVFAVSPMDGRIEHLSSQEIILNP
jgi:hypothetical protein